MTIIELMLFVLAPSLAFLLGLMSTWLREGELR